MNELSKKWWYRLLQVVYGLFCAFLILCIVSIAAAFWPAVNVSQSSYEIKCDNGLDFGNFKGDQLDWSATYIENVTWNGIVKYACSVPNITTGQINQFAADYTSNSNNGWTKYDAAMKIPVGRNYKAFLTLAVYTIPWWVTVTAVLISFLSAAILASLIRAMTLYVLIKRPFLKTLLFRKIGLNV